MTTTGRVMEFPDAKSSQDLDAENYQNYLKWQLETEQNRRHSQTQFNRYQTRTMERTTSHVEYKEEAERAADEIREMVERRLSMACDCNDCEGLRRAITTATTSSSSCDSTTDPGSPTHHHRRRDSNTSIGQRSLDSQPGTTVKGPTSSSSRNSLVVSAEPQSRHHQRRRQRERGASEP